MKVAIIHYWLTNYRGGEKVLEALCELYPNADIYTHVYSEEKFKNSIISLHNIRTTFISKLPFSKTRYQMYLPFMPLALESIDLNGYDLIISSESGPAKGVIPPPGVPHICYCHSPMRYLWDMYNEYLSGYGRLKKILFAPLLHYLRRWDQLSSVQVTQYIANSRFVAKRIASYYRRESIVVHPPVDFDAFQNLEVEDGNYYLMLGQLVGYKKPDIAIDTFNELGSKLVVVGEGEMFENLRRRSNSNIHFTGRAAFSKILKYVSGCKALIFPGKEDFGIVPLEAMAAGKPVIAFNGGGARETVVDGVTGILFNGQSVESLKNAIATYESISSSFDPNLIKKHAETFGKGRFKNQIQDIVSIVLQEHSD